MTQNVNLSPINGEMGEDGELFIQPVFPYPGGCFVRRVNGYNLQNEKENPDERSSKRVNGPVVR